jgi:hypothetical protein
MTKGELVKHLPRHKRTKEMTIECTGVSFGFDETSIFCAQCHTFYSRLTALRSHQSYYSCDNGRAIRRARRLDRDELSTLVDELEGSLRSDSASPPRPVPRRFSYFFLN